MRRRHFITALEIFVLLGCKSLGQQNEVANVDSAEVNIDLSAEDVSILVPLSQTNEAMNPVFGSTGDGFCNAPDFLNTDGGGEPIMEKGLFERFAKRVYGGESGQCPLAAVSAADAGQLINDMRHVAMLKGIRQDVCNYESWKIVGFRLGSCVNRSDFPAMPNHGQITGKACFREVRLIAQPFKLSGKRWIDTDDSMHLIYAMPNAEEIVNDLKALAKVKAKVLAANSMDYDARDFTPAQKDLFKKNPEQRRLIHRPHPALRSEMKHCQTGESSTFAIAFKKFLAKHTKQSTMIGIAWMTSDQGPGVWSFGSELVKNGKLLVDSEPDKPLETPCVDSFSNDLFAQEKLSLDLDQILETDLGEPCGAFPPIHLAAWMDFQGNAEKNKPEIFTRRKFNADADVQAMANEKDPTKKKQVLAKIESKFGDNIGVFNDLVNPEKLSQVGKMSSNCTSCHLVDQTFNKIKVRLRTLDYQGTHIVPNMPPIWKGYLEPARAMTNLRNFGYGPGFAFGVPRRTLFETAEEVRMLNNAFGP